MNSNMFASIKCDMWHWYSEWNGIWERASEREERKRKRQQMLESMQTKCNVSNGLAYGVSWYLFFFAALRYFGWMWKYFGASTESHHNSSNLIYIYDIINAYKVISQNVTFRQTLPCRFESGLMFGKAYRNEELTANIQH